MNELNGDKIDKAMKQAQVSNEIEGIEIKKEYTALIKSRLNNEITEEEFQQKVKELVSKK